MNLLQRFLLGVVSLNALLFCAHNNQNEKAAKPLECVTHIVGIQKIIAEYCDQEWVPVTEVLKKDITSMTCSPDGRYIAYALWKKRGGDLRLGVGSMKEIERADTEIEIWDESTKKIMKSKVPIDLGNAVQLVFCPDGKYLAVACNYIWFIDLVTMQCIELEHLNGWPLPTEPQADIRFARCPADVIAFSPNGQYLAIAHNNILTIIHKADGSNNKGVYRIYKYFSCMNIAFSADSKKVIAWGSEESELLVVDLNLGKVTTSMVSEGLTADTVLAILPLENCVAMPAVSKILIQNYTTGEKILYGKVEKVIQAIAPVQVNFLALGTQDGNIKICDISNYREDLKNGVAWPKDYVHVIIGASQKVRELYCSVDGKYLTALLGAKRNASTTSGVIKRWVNLSHYLMGPSSLLTKFH